MPNKNDALPKNDPWGIQRGDYASSAAVKGIFSVGRLISGPIQYALITAHPLARFGMLPPPTGLIHAFGHEMQRLPFLAALMPSVLSVKHVLWLSLWCRERVTPQMALFGILGDLGFESLNSLVFSAASANPLFSERHFFLGMSIFYAALAVETVAELQRAAFKSRPENEGKLCTTGFWAITRHINFTANIFFGLGVGLATGGWLYVIPAAGMYLANFITNAIPGKEAYMSHKYGRQWTEYEKKVPWKLIPGIY